MPLWTETLLNLLLSAVFTFAITTLSFTPDVVAQELVRVRLMSQQDEIIVSGFGLRVQGVENKFQQIAIPRSDHSQHCRLGHRLDQPHCR